MKSLLSEVRSCQLCKQYLPFPPKPVLRASREAKILVIGQAPGIKVQQSGIPWDDLSGKQLRRWLDVSPEQFYDEKLFAIVPMGFCYPGKGKSGDLPPRRECAPLWHPRLLKLMPNIKLILLIGKYAQDYYLGNRSESNLTKTVKNFRDYLPLYFPLVHPSPRNLGWQKNNPWFEKELVPELQFIVKSTLNP